MHKCKQWQYKQPFCFVTIKFKTAQVIRQALPQGIHADIVTDLLKPLIQNHLLDPQQCLQHLGLDVLLLLGDDCQKPLCPEVMAVRHVLLQSDEVKERWNLR